MVKLSVVKIKWWHMETSDFKLFNKWSFEDVNTIDISLTDYINYSGKYAKIIPHSEGRYQIN